VDRFQTGCSVGWNGVVVPREHQRAKLGDQRRIAAEQEAKWFADVYVHCPHVDTLTNERENIASVGGCRHR
jgi:hypothetical protein